MFRNTDPLSLFALDLTFKGVDSLPRGACLALTLKVQIPSSRRHCLQDPDSLLENPFCSRGLDSLLEKSFEVQIPSLRRLYLLGPNYLLEDPLSSRGPDALLEKSLDVVVPSPRCTLSLEVMLSSLRYSHLQGADFLLQCAHTKSPFYSVISHPLLRRPRSFRS